MISYSNDKGGWQQVFCFTELFCFANPIGWSFYHSSKYLNVYKWFKTEWKIAGPLPNISTMALISVQAGQPYRLQCGKHPRCKMATATAQRQGQGVHESQLLCFLSTGLKSHLAHSSRSPTGTTLPSGHCLELRQLNLVTRKIGSKFQFPGVQLEMLLQAKFGKKKCWTSLL